MSKLVSAVNIMVLTIFNNNFNYFEIISIMFNDNKCESKCVDFKIIH